MSKMKKLRLNGSQIVRRNSLITKEVERAVAMAVSSKKWATDKDVAIDREDLEHECLLAIIEKIDVAEATGDEELKKRLTKPEYIYTLSSNTIKNVLRSISTKSRGGDSRDKDGSYKIVYMNDVEEELLDIIYEESSLDDVDVVMFFDNLMSSFKYNNIALLVIKLRYMGYTINEIAEQIGHSYKETRTIMERDVPKLIEQIKPDVEDLIERHSLKI